MERATVRASSDYILDGNRIAGTHIINGNILQFSSIHQWAFIIVSSSLELGAF